MCKSMLVLFQAWENFDIDQVPYDVHSKVDSDATVLTGMDKISLASLDRILNFIVLDFHHCNASNFHMFYWCTFLPQDRHPNQISENDHTKKDNKIILIIKHNSH